MHTTVSNVNYFGATFDGIQDSHSEQGYFLQKL